MYKLLFSQVVQKQTERIPRKDLEKIKKLVLDLQHDPRPLKCKKLVGGMHDYRMRYRKWRILYSIDDKSKEVVIYGLLDRKEAYR